MDVPNEQLFKLILDIHGRLPMIQQRVDEIYDQQQTLTCIPSKVSQLEYRVGVLESKNKNKTAITLSTKHIILAAILSLASGIFLAIIQGGD